MPERKVVVTGASGGIGAALAEMLTARGDHVLLVARRGAELHEVARRAGPHAFVHVADVTSREAVQGAVRDALARLGHVDVWVNNVGRGITRPVSELTD